GFSSDEEHRGGTYFLHVSLSSISRGNANCSDRKSFGHSGILFSRPGYVYVGTAAPQCGPHPREKSIKLKITKTTKIHIKAIFPTASMEKFVLTAESCSPGPVMYMWAVPRLNVARIHAKNP